MHQIIPIHTKKHTQFNKNETIYIVRIFSTEEEFIEAKGDYQKALNEAEYAEKLEYTADTKKAKHNSMQLIVSIARAI